MSDVQVILVVCNGNIHRSVIAEYCLKQALVTRVLSEKLSVISRGVQGTCGTKEPKHKKLRDYPREWPLSRPVLEELGIDIAEHKWDTITRADVEKVAIILTMDRKVLSDLPNSLFQQFPGYHNKMRLFLELDGRCDDVPDCWGANDGQLHRRVIMLIHRVANESIDTLLAWVTLGIQY